MAKETNVQATKKGDAWEQANVNARLRRLREMYGLTKKEGASRQ